VSAVKHVIESIQGKHPLSAHRSGEWPRVRAAHLLGNPTCAVCGGDKKIEVHHIHPFHLHPELELDPSNLITLCESGKGGMNCHLAEGHLGDFHSFNVDVVQDTAKWAAKIKGRP